MGSKSSRRRQEDYDPPPVEPLPLPTDERVMDVMVHGCQPLELGQVRLCHNCHKDFTKPMCARCPIILFVLFRFVVAGYALGFLVYHLVREIQGVVGAKVFIYLETWTYIEITIYLVLSFVNVAADIHQEYKGIHVVIHSDHTPWRFKLQWLFFNISLTSASVCTITFWTWVIITGIVPTTKAYEIINLNGMWIIVAVLEVGLVTIPLRFEHIIYPLAYGLVYLIFTLIYWGAGGTDPYGNRYIYVFLDFGKHPLWAVFAVSLEIIASFLIHGLFYVFFLYKEKLFSKCCPVVQRQVEELEMLAPKD